MAPVLTQVRFFIHDEYAGISAFVNVPGNESQRNAQMLAVGALLPLSYGRLGKSWLHAEGLQELAKYGDHLGFVGLSGADIMSTGSTSLIRTAFGCWKSTGRRIRSQKNMSQTAVAVVRLGGNLVREAARNATDIVDLAP